MEILDVNQNSTPSNATTHTSTITEITTTKNSVQPTVSRKERSLSDDELALHKAAVNGNLEVVKLLIEKGANMNSPDKDGKTPLHNAALHAAFRGHLEVVKLLIEKGADFKSLDKNGDTPLHWAAYWGNLDVVNLLIEKGADFKFPNNNGKTPLNIAIDVGHSQIVAFLLSVELFDAVKAGNLGKVKEFVEKGADVNSPDKDGWTPLYVAAQFGKLDVVKLLIEKGANVNSSDKDGWTPLHFAAFNGYLEVVKLLIEKGADFQSPDTPLHLAVQNGHLEVVKLLIEKGADFKSPDKHNQTPLHWAAANGNLDVVNLLIEKEADFKSPDKRGNTPLHLAAGRWNNLEIVRLLVEKGADVNAKNRHGATPLNIAHDRGDLQIIESLSPAQRKNRGRRDASSNSWASNGVVNFVKGFTESPALLTSREHNNKVTDVPEIVVNNILLLGIFAASLFNKTQSKQQPIHANLLSPIAQSELKNGVDGQRIKKAIEEFEEKYPDTYVDEVSLHGNKTGLHK